MPLSSKWLIAQATRRAQGRNAHSFSLLTSPMTPFARSSCRSRRRLTKRITGKIVSFTVRPRAPTTAAERPSPTDSRAAETKPLPRRLRLKRQLAATMSALLAPRSRKIAAARRRRRPASLKRRPKRGSSKALTRNGCFFFASRSLSAPGACSASAAVEEAGGAAEAEAEAGASAAEAAEAKAPISPMSNWKVPLRKSSSCVMRVSMMNLEQVKPIWNTAEVLEMLGAPGTAMGPRTSRKAEKGTYTTSGVPTGGMYCAW
mmetsp:Transcript_79259/g.256928  ORF Transcript_79259/g.256928 Transcript_79259/m.256928 type:complete len:260 (+) Transcript_79259:87-866(+)